MEWCVVIKYFLSLPSVDVEQREVEISLIFLMYHIGCNSVSSQFSLFQMIQAAVFPPGDPGVLLCLVPFLVFLFKLIFPSKRDGSAGKCQKPLCIPKPEM